MSRGFGIFISKVGAAGTASLESSNKVIGNRFNLSNTLPMPATTYTIRQPGCTAWVENVDAETALIEYDTASVSGLNVQIIDDETGESVEVEDLEA